MAQARQPGVEYRLRVVQGGSIGAEFALTGSSVRIGRGDTNDIVLTDSDCSRNHAELQRQGPGYVVRDLGSRNGVYVNGQPVSQTRPLREGDTIQVGRTGFQFYAFGAAPARQAMPRDNGKLRPFLFLFGGGALGVLAIVAVFGNRPQPSQLETTVSLVSDLGNPASGNGIGVSRGDSTTASKGRGDKKNGGDETLDKKKQARLILAEAQRDAEAGRLVDAKEGFKKAHDLDPDCKSCVALLSRVNRRIQDEVENSMNAGKEYMEVGRYEAAALTFERVLLLTDESNPYHENAQRYLEEARKKSKNTRPF